MSDSQTKQVQAIQALLAERRKYEQWIAQLEARKQSTPPHVFEKVHGDYSARLQEAQAKLSSEAGAVQELATAVSTSLVERDRAADQKQDERSEAELRAAVGEYSEKEWDKLRAKLDGAIADLTGERDALQRELETLEALLTEAGSSAVVAEKEPVVTPPRPSVPVGKVSDAPALRTSAPPAKRSEPAPASAPARDVAGKGSGDVDELAFLRSVLGTTTPYTSGGGLSAVPDARTAPASEPPPRKSAAPRAPAAAPARASVETRKPAPELFAAAEPRSPAPEARQGEVKESAVASPFGVPTPRSVEGVRTLKCQECGTLNFPTEWYCERCGGELAAF